MLRITIDESPLSVTLRLEGKLIGLWVEEVERCWRKVFVTLGPRTVLVDLSAVNFVDRAGRVLLTRMQSAGFRFEGSGPMSEYLMEQISRDSGALN
jgi:anti-anti-sigma regulatory factor